MSNQDNNIMISNNNPLPDYLDVSSEEEPIKEKGNEKLKEDSEEKYYTKNRRHKSRSRSRNRYHNERRSYSRSHHHYRNKHHHIHKESESSYNKYNNLKNSRSSSRDNYYEKENKYHYSKNRNRNHYSKYSDNSNSYSRAKYKRSHNRHKSHNKSPSNSNKSKSSSYEKYKTKIKEEKKEYYKQNNKWTDGEKKSEFRQIKIEKYDKNKTANNNNKSNELKNSKQKEISQLRKDLTVKKEEKEIIIEKEKPNFEPSGILQKDLEMEYNKIMNNKILVNYNPPSDSIIPTDIWFFFKFTGDKKEPEETYKLINKEFFLIGKDPRICDIRIKQQNISRQHAVIQFRKIKKEYDWEIIPYLIDLNSTNGTYLNGEKIDNKKYYELRDKDELNFGDKKIDFVLMKMK